MWPGVSHLDAHYKRGVDFTRLDVALTPRAILLLFTLLPGDGDQRLLPEITWRTAWKANCASKCGTGGDCETSPPGKKSAGLFYLYGLVWIGKDIINASQKLIQLDDSLIALLGAISPSSCPAAAAREEAG